MQIKMEETNKTYNLNKDYNLSLEDKNQEINNLDLDIISGVDIKIIEKVDKPRNININIQENTKVVYYIIEGYHEKTEIQRLVKVGKNSELQFKIFSLNTGKVEQNIIIDLDGEDAKVDYKLVVISGMDSKNRIDVRINNNAPRTYANIWQKGVVFDGGITDLIATGFIKKGSSKAASYQESRILLLDEAARGEASPNLLIDYFDVEAGHKASVSRVDESAMYYLNTRGVTKKEAEKLMIKAFIAPLVDSIELEDIKEEVENKLKESLQI